MTTTTGMKVPNFTASATGDKVFTLSDHTGKYVVLYFYPKDNTPGCTNESIEFNELSPKFKKKKLRDFWYISRQYQITRELQK